MKIFLTIAAIMSLVLVSMVFAGHQTSDEASAGASVTVTTFIDMTLTDTGTAGFDFDSLDPGTSNKNESDQVDGSSSTTPAATVTREATSNVDVLVRLKGDDFSGAGAIPIGNVAYNDDGVVDGAAVNLPQTDLTTTYPGSAYATLTSGNSTLDIWFWLDIPPGQAAGAYTSTFSFEGS